MEIPDDILSSIRELIPDRKINQHELLTIIVEDEILKAWWESNRENILPRIFEFINKIYGIETVNLSNLG